MNKIINSLVTIINNSTYKINSLSNINLYTIIFVLFYCFIIAFACDFNVYKIAALSISFILSFAISTFVADKFKFSDNIYIKNVQKFIFKLIITILGCFILSYIGVYLISDVHCDPIDNNDNSENSTNNDNS